jgi:ABC-2 type transport system ATP-binding protein
MNSVLTVQNLTKNYGRLEALKGISFEVQEDEIFALIGPNGAGKTTALRIVATILQPTSGSLTLAGLDVLKEANEVRGIISYLPEEAGAYKNMTGEAYLRFMAELFFADRQSQDQSFETARKISDLGERLGSKIGTYSKGMTRKLLLSRALMTRPKLAILDEPTSGLDVINALEIRNTIREFARKGMSVLLSSHNMLEIEYLSDRVAIVDKGRIHEMGTPVELKERYNSANLEEVFAEVAQ